MKRYKQHVEHDKGQVFSVDMVEHPEGEWVKFRDHMKILYDDLNAILTDEAFERHKQDNARMFGYEYKKKENPL